MTGKNDIDEYIVCADGAANMTKMKENLNAESFTTHEVPTCTHLSISSPNV
jgi:hypothetical protein